MSSSTKLTDQEKQNGRRKLLIPSKEIQELMKSILKNQQNPYKT